MNKYGKENISSCTGAGPVRLSLSTSCELDVKDLDTVLVAKSTVSSRI